jgi:GDP-L-fucose synthase
MVAGIAQYDGPVEWDTTRPDGAPRKLLDSSKILATGWKPRISPLDGLAATYDWYINHESRPATALSEV